MAFIVLYLLIGYMTLLFGETIKWSDFGNLDIIYSKEENNDISYEDDAVFKQDTFYVVLVWPLYLSFFLSAYLAFGIVMLKCFFNYIRISYLSLYNRYSITGKQKLEK